MTNSSYKFSNGATVKHEDLFAYTLEAPQGANVNSKNVKPPKDAIYNNIWNIVHPNDLVPKVAMMQYGFTRFGTDKYIPTKFYDPDNYNTNLQIFGAMYSMKHDFKGYIANQFEMYGVPVESIGLLIASMGSNVKEIKAAAVNNMIVKDNRKANYDANIVETILLEELTKRLGNRDSYCKKYQDNVKNLLLAIMNDDSKVKKDDIKNLIKGALFSAVGTAINGKNNDIISKSLEGTKGETADKLLKTMLPLLIDMAIERPNEMLSTMIYIDNVFQNHDPEVIIAHLQSQDSYYIDDMNKKYGANLDPVALIDNVDFARASFFGFNDLAVADANVKDSKNYIRKKNVNDLKALVNVDGHVWGRSDIIRIYPICAFGYYSYVTEEKMELFCPANKKYKLSFKSYSKKPYHKVDFKMYYQYFTLGNSSVIKKELSKYYDKVIFNSDRITKTVDVRG